MPGLLHHLPKHLSACREGFSRVSTCPPSVRVKFPSLQISHSSKKCTDATQADHRYHIGILSQIDPAGIVRCRVNNHSRIWRVLTNERTDLSKVAELQRRTNKRPFLRSRRVSSVHQTVVNLRFNTALARIALLSRCFRRFPRSIRNKLNLIDGSYS